jgi:hypothetical protein
MDLTVREVLDRYGPTLAVVAVLALLVVLLPGNASDSSDVLADQVDNSSGLVDGGFEGDFDGDTSGGSGGGSVRGASGGGSSAAVGGTDTGTDGGTGTTGPGGPGTDTGTDGPGGPTSSSTQWGPGIFPKPGPETQCREDGRMPGFSFYQPVCVPKFSGNNGGATWKGVTAKTVKVVRIYGEVDPATEAALRALGAADTHATADRVDKALFHYFNNHVETYGREVTLDWYAATGADDDDEAARSDAAQLASDGVFAVYPSVATAVNEPILAEALAAKGVMCFCTTSESKSYYSRVSPYVWSSLPMVEEYYTHLAEYIGKRMARKPAKWAGTSVPPLDTSVRKFGLIYIEGQGDRVNPGAAEALKHFKAELAKYGVSLTKDLGYKLELDRGQEQAINLIAQMKDAGVTSLACFCDPLTPVFFTKEATRSQYFPEHIITGSVLMDTTFFGRTYDQAQWQHAFGISPLWVFFTNVSTSSGYTAYHHGNPGDPEGRTACNGEPCEGVGINVRQAPIQLLFNGIHYAGPILTPQNLQLGFLRSGRTGGNVKAPLVYFTKDSPTAIKDLTEVWWNPSQPGLDETGRDGVGGLMKAQGGKRYEPGQWPTANPFAFSDDSKPIFTSDTPPETFDHDADGHTHGRSPDPKRQRCRSC